MTEGFLCNYMSYYHYFIIIIFIITKFSLLFNTTSQENQWCTRVQVRTIDRSSNKLGSYSVAKVIITRSPSFHDFSNLFRSVDYINGKGSFLDQNTLKATMKNGNEVFYDFLKEVFHQQVYV